MIKLKAKYYLLFYWKTCMPYQYDNHLTSYNSKCRSHLEKENPDICTTAKACPNFEIPDGHQGESFSTFEDKGHLRFLELDITLQRKQILG